MKVIVKFAFQLGAKIALNPDFIVEKGGRYFILNNALLKFAQKNFYYAGAYLGKVKNGKFFPSFNLLSMLAKGKANNIVVEKRAAWLFICGRDIFRKGILAVHCPRKRGKYVLVLNNFGDCLGFGRTVRGFDGGARNEVAVKNILDVGDFLRREK